MALVVVAAALRLPGAASVQEGLETVHRGLDLALFVNTENQGTIRRRFKYRPTMSRTFSMKKRSPLDSLKVSERCGLQAEGPPDAMNGRGRVADRPPSSGEGSNGSASGGILIQRQPDRFRDGRHRRFDAGRRGGVRRTDRRGPPPHSAGFTLHLPERCPRCLRTAISLFSNPSAAKTIRARRCKPLRRLATTRQRLQFGGSSSLKRDRHRRSAINRASQIET